MKCKPQQMALPQNELELDQLVHEIKGCRAKLKQMRKRFDELKRLNQAHNFNPNEESE